MVDRAIKANDRTKAMKLIFVAKSAPIGPGVVQGTKLIILPTIPLFTANQAIVALRIGASKKGIKFQHKDSKNTKTH